MKKYSLLAVSILTLFLGILGIESIPILKSTFQLEKIEAVLFTLTQNTEGSLNFVVALISSALNKSLIIVIFISIIIAIILIAKQQLYKKGILKSRPSLTYIRLIFTANIIVFTIFAYSIFTQLPVIQFLSAWNDINAIPNHSDFYQKEFIHPDSTEIQFNKKQNLILIFLESMEYNFQDSIHGGNLSTNLIPEISEFIAKEQSFIPGGTPAYGMGWTMADIIAKTCGIPATLPPKLGNLFAKYDGLLPGTTCLTDILIKNGYRITLSQGTNIKFGEMEAFLKSHSNPQTYDLMSYEKSKLINEEDKSVWGIQDSVLYELAKKHIQNLSKQENNWVLWLFTIDTHSPYGFPNSTCKIPPNIPEQKQYPYVIKCASRQLYNFIKWAESQEWFKNTTIAVMGDHASPASPDAIGFNDATIQHYWLNFFINSAKEQTGNHRKFTSMDFFPTILESIGAEIPNGSLGLGRSLYTAKQTLLEKYGIDSLDKALQKRSLEYNSLLYGKNNL